MGWGSLLGSPRIKSSKKAAGNAKTRDDNSINLAPLRSAIGIME
jgi:hypothetical protein